MENAKQIKTTRLQMKLEESFANEIIEAYEKQRESGIEFKGDFLGQLFTDAISSKPSENEYSTGKPWVSISLDEYEKEKTKAKWFKILFFVFLAFFILLMFLYRRSIRYA